MSLRAREVLLGPTKNREAFDQARKLFLQALELDPDFAKAYAGLGLAYMFDYQNRWSDNPDASLGLAEGYAERAIAKDPKEALAHAVAAVTATFRRDIDRAQSEIDIALSLNPNMAMAYNIQGGIRIYLGRPEEAIPLIERAMRLDPAANQQFLHLYAHGQPPRREVRDRHGRAAGAHSPRTQHRFLPFPARLRARISRPGGEDPRVWRELKEINPKYSFQEHLGRLPFRNEEEAQRITDELKKAGVLD